MSEESMGHLKSVASKGNEGPQLFENLPELITPDMAAKALHTTRGTVYQWRARPKKYGVPEGMFIKHGRKLLIRRDVLVTWVLSR